MDLNEIVIHAWLSGASKTAFYEGRETPIKVDVGLEEES